MRELSTLATLEGRSVIRDIFRELRFERQMSSFSATMLLWRICTKETELKRFSVQEVSILYPLGTMSGTSLWLQEIINRFYYSTINSFVYFGAAILLFTVGLRRIYDSIFHHLMKMKVMNIPMLKEAGNFQNYSEKWEKFPEIMPQWLFVLNKLQMQCKK